MHCQKMPYGGFLGSNTHIVTRLWLPGESITMQLRMTKIMDFDTGQTSASQRSHIWTRSVIVTRGVVN